jgi:hypothetical protein
MRADTRRAVIPRTIATRPVAPTPLGSRTLRPAQRPLPSADPSTSPNGLLPHELAWGALFALVGVRLVAASGFGATTLLWWGLALLAALPVVASLRTPSEGRWRVRLLACLVVMNGAYALMGRVVAATGGVRRDALLQRIDTRLFGAPLPLYLDRSAAHPAAVELLSACYFAFLPYVAVSCVGYALRRPARERPVAAAFFAGLFTVYAIGFLGYFLVPARGPWLDIPGAFAHPLPLAAGGWITRLNDAVVRHGSNGVDVFPSLHIAVSTFILLFDRRHARWRYRLCVLPAIGLWVSTVALRYHYGVDVLAGFALALVGLRLARWIEESGSRNRRAP